MVAANLFFKGVIMAPGWFCFGNAQRRWINHKTSFFDQNTLHLEMVVWHLDYSCLVCWSLTSLCHSNGHIETMPAREINPFTALTRIRSQFLRTQWSTSNHQRVDTTTPQTAEPSGLAGLFMWQINIKCTQWLICRNMATILIFQHINVSTMVLMDSLYLITYKEVFYLCSHHT